MEGLLLSREFWVMVIGLVVAFLVALVPQLESSKTELIAAITSLTFIIIGVLGGEKIAAARSTGATQAERQSVKSQGASPAVKYPPTP